MDINNSIPECILNLAKDHPEIICNPISENVVNAVKQNDKISIAAAVHLGGLVDKKLHTFLKTELKEGDSILVYHCKNKGYWTSVLSFYYEYENMVVTTTESVEANNIVAIVKIPKDKKLLLRNRLDDQQLIFMKLCKEILA